MLGRKREGVSLTLSPSVDSVRDECSTRVEDGDAMLLHHFERVSASLLLPLSLSHTLSNTQRTEKQRKLSRFLSKN